MHECVLVGGMGMVAIVVGVYRGGDGSNSRGCEGGDGWGGEECDSCSVVGNIRGSVGRCCDCVGGSGGHKWLFTINVIDYKVFFHWSIMIISNRLPNDYSKTLIFETREFQ